MAKDSKTPDTAASQFGKIAGDFTMSAAGLSMGKQQSFFGKIFEVISQVNKTGKEQEKRAKELELTVTQMKSLEQQKAKREMIAKGEKLKETASSATSKSPSVFNLKDFGGISKKSDDAMLKSGKMLSDSIDRKTAVDKEQPKKMSDEVKKEGFAAKFLSTIKGGLKETVTGERRQGAVQAALQATGLGELESVFGISGKLEGYLEKKKAKKAADKAAEVEQAETAKEMEMPLEDYKQLTAKKEAFEKRSEAHKKRLELGVGGFADVTEAKEKQKLKDDEEADKREEEAENRKAQRRLKAGKGPKGILTEGEVPGALIPEVSSGMAMGAGGGISGDFTTLNGHLEKVVEHTEGTKNEIRDLKASLTGSIDNAAKEVIKPIEEQKKATDQIVDNTYKTKEAVEVIKSKPTEGGGGGGVTDLFDGGGGGGKSGGKTTGKTGGKVGKFAKLRGLASKAGGLVSKAGGLVSKAGGVTRGLGALAGGVGSLGSAAGLAGKFAGPAGAALDVGMGVSDLLQGKEQTEMPSGFDMLSPMKWGMYTGRKTSEGLGIEGGKGGSGVYDILHGANAAKEDKEWAEKVKVMQEKSRAKEEKVGVTEPLPTIPIDEKAKREGEVPPPGMITADVKAKREGEAVFGDAQERRLNQRREELWVKADAKKEREGEATPVIKPQMTSQERILADRAKTAEAQRKAAGLKPATTEEQIRLAGAVPSIPGTVEQAPGFTGSRALTAEEKAQYASTGARMTARVKPGPEVTQVPGPSDLSGKPTEVPKPTIISAPQPTQSQTQVQRTTYVDDMNIAMAQQMGFM